MKRATVAALAVVLFSTTATVAYAFPTDDEMAAERARRQANTAQFNADRAAYSSTGYRSDRKVCPAGQICPVEDLIDPDTGGILSGFDLFGQNQPLYWRVLQVNRVMCRAVPSSAPRVVNAETFNIAVALGFRFDGGTVRVRYRNDFARQRAEAERQAARQAWEYARRHCDAVGAGDTVLRGYPLSQVQN